MEVNFVLREDESVAFADTDAQRFPICMTFYA